jgi:hypothetical protein
MQLPSVVRVSMTSRDYFINLAIRNMEMRLCIMVSQERDLKS